MPGPEAWHGWGAQMEKPGAWSPVPCVSMRVRDEKRKQWATAAGAREGCLQEAALEGSWQ